MIVEMIAWSYGVLSVGEHIMQTQVITITPSGEMQSLQRKRGRGVDVRQFGHAAIERASEITWNEPQQCWHGRLLDRNDLEWQ